MTRKFITQLMLSGLVAMAISCSSGGDANENEAAVDPPKSMVASTPQSLEEAEKDWATDYGIGPIAEFELPETIDNTLAESGKVVYEAKCTACHKPDKDFIGPAPKGILANRTPAWVMNMILNPEEMVQKNHIARQLLIKFNGAPMANQNLTEDEARAVLEYFRTL